MELKFLVPKLETFGNLEYTGKGEDITEGFGRNEKLVGRVYKLCSDYQIGEIEVVLPAEVPQKGFQYEEIVQLVNPKLIPEGYVAGGQPRVKWKCFADDILKVNKQ